VTASLLHRLAERHDVALSCFRDEDEPPTDDALRARCALVDETVVRRPGARGWLSRARQLGKPLWGYPNLVARATAPGYGERVKALAASWDPQIVHFELAETARYVGALRECPAPRLLVDHEPGARAAQDWSDAATWARRSWRRLDVIAWTRFARKTLRGMDRIVVFTERDRAALEELVPGAAITTIPISTEIPAAPLNPAGFGRPTVLFFGAYLHPPNADAAARLLRTILPGVRGRHPDVALELVGESPTAEMQTHADENVLVTGRVDSLTPHLDRAAAVVVPLRIGGGMRVKVLEALAAGKAVVASPRALAGLTVKDREHVLVAERDEEFVDAISSVLSDEALRVRLGTNARRWAESALDWDEIIAAYERVYRELLSEGE
jgi:glycosyltransferase involved in cell wall biosynthesis